jgi:hypothetical protein
MNKIQMELFAEFWMEVSFFYEESLNLDVCDIKFNNSKAAELHSCISLEL